MGDVAQTLLAGLTPGLQEAAVRSRARRLLVVAGAGSGKTEVMARRIAWWVGVDKVEKHEIVAFTFTEKAAEEMKFRIRRWIGTVTPEGEDATLGRMYVGTIHAFCIQMLRELLPGRYGAYDVLDDAGRLALVQRGFNSPLGLRPLKTALGKGQNRTIDEFLLGYDMLNEYGELEVALPPQPPPMLGRDESDWVRQASLITDVGEDAVSAAFATAAARYYAYLHARRFLDFSTAQAELVRILQAAPELLQQVRSTVSHVVVDESQDMNPVQDALVRLLVGEKGMLTAVGDHRQAIFGWRGGRVDLMARWHKDLAGSSDGEVLELPHNFRSTGRVIELANRWAETISPPGTMTTGRMQHGNTDRSDFEPSHVASLHFEDRDEEASWIADTIKNLVNENKGAQHDTDAGTRGIGLPDIALLVRSSTDVRTYMEALQQKGIPSIVRAGPDLFAQPEVLLMLGALGLAAGIEEFWGGRSPSIPSIVAEVLDCSPTPTEIVESASSRLRRLGLPMSAHVEARLVRAGRLLKDRLSGTPVGSRDVAGLETDKMIEFLTRRAELRRVFPQTIFQWLASEAGVAIWDGAGTPRSRTAMFHLGQFSGLMTGIETPGWVRPGDFRWQIIALAHWGARNARTDEAPLLVPPDAVTISTVHSAKGLEFPVVFLADVKGQRFPSNQARRQPSLPYSGPIIKTVDPVQLADNENLDSERRLMYVALTRTERYLFVTSPKTRSKFKKELDDMIDEVGGLADADPLAVPGAVKLLPSQHEPATRLVTSFSDLRYYLECPHDYYLRKVLGFSPTIDQAFGYGRGIHNLMREVHQDPARWAALVDDPSRLADEVQGLIDDGFFYLRYTTGEPLHLMQEKAKKIVEQYVDIYRRELAALTFEPERAFESLIEEAQVLVSGAIDLIRRDDPPTVTLIDFKSGDPAASTRNASALDEGQMALQIGLYALAARKELEYAPELGLVRYLGADRNTPRRERELTVRLDAAALANAKQTVVDAATAIQGRQWDIGPRPQSDSNGGPGRCRRCDFLSLCGRPEAISMRDESK